MVELSAVAPARRAPPLTASLAVVALVLAGLSLAVGPAPLSWHDVAAALAGRADAITADIVWGIRVPRAALGLLVGGMLGLAGATLQGLLRNPLADPGVIGVSNTAALGAVIALYFGLAKTAPFVLPGLAVCGALIGLAALWPVARRGEGPLTLILAGVAISTLAGAAISLALNLAPNPYAVSEIAIWLLGSLTDRSVQHLVLAAPLILAGGGLLLLSARALDGLALGEDAARSLGFDLDRVRLLVVAGVALGVGAAVAVCGAVGFVGLIAPHLVRPFTDGRPSQTLVPSALVGAGLLSVADIAVRLIPTQTELRLGVVTAFLGAPIFVAVLFRTRRVA